jgi:hypothetical protein
LQQMNAETETSRRAETADRILKKLKFLSRSHKISSEHDRQDCHCHRGENEHEVFARCDT